jgi:hypothetical protein
MLMLVLSFLLLLLFLIRSSPFCLSFFHSSLVVLAVTTTRFSFFLSFFISFFLSILMLFPISKYIAQRTGCYNDERTFRVIVRKGRKRETRRLPQRSLPIQKLDRCDALFLCDYSITDTGSISLFLSYFFPFFHYFELDKSYQ